MSINPLNFLTQFNKMKNEAKEMESKLEALRIKGSAANLVHITINGKFDLIDVKLDQIAVDPRDIPMLETLIKSAFVDAAQKAKVSISSEFESANLGGLESLFKSMS